MRGNRLRAGVARGEVQIGTWVNMIRTPAVLTLLSIPLMFSIAEGIGLGLIAAAVLALGTGSPRRLNAVGYVLAAIFLAQFLHLGPFR
jgi:AGZA family xanthine/uracil permease-like MFS transporter